MSENLSKNERFFVRIFLGFSELFLDFRIFPVFSGFFRILISCPKFLFEKDKFFIFISFLNFYFLFFLFFCEIQYKKKIVPILEISQGQCPRIGIFLLLNPLFK